jgi:hypothetical protein
MGRELSKAPLHPWHLDEYQMKGVAKGTICKYMKREQKALSRRRSQGRVHDIEPLSII